MFYEQISKIKNHVLFCNPCFLQYLSDPNYYLMQDFIHLHVHTYYSILDGQSKISRLVDKAVENGMKGMALTDLGVMFGIKEFADYCAGVNKKRKA